VKGLSADERVILNPGSDLQDGAKVRVLGTLNPDSQMPPAVPATKS